MNIGSAWRTRQNFDLEMECKIMVASPGKSVLFKIKYTPQSGLKNRNFNHNSYSFDNYLQIYLEGRAKS